MTQEVSKALNITALEEYLHTTLRVTLSDKRVIYGRLICTDRDLNLVLCESEEHAPESADPDAKVV